MTEQAKPGKLFPPPGTDEFGDEGSTSPVIGPIAAAACALGVVVVFAFLAEGAYSDRATAGGMWKVFVGICVACLLLAIGLVARALWLRATPDQPEPIQ